MSKKSVVPMIGDQMIARRVLMHARDVVFLKGIIDAHEGLAQVFAEKGGELTIAAPAGQIADLDGLLTALQGEIAGMQVLTQDEPGDPL